MNSKKRLSTGRKNSHSSRRSGFTPRNDWSRRVWHRLLAICFLLFLAGGMALAAPTAGEIEWSFLGGSGGRVASSGYVLEGTLGQPVVGQASSQSSTLCAGFWCGVSQQHTIYLPLIMRE
jgi:hypothetical protein